MPLLLDSSVVIDMLRNRPAADRVRRLIDAGEIPYTCAIVAEEVMRGMRDDETARTANLFLYMRPAPLGVNEGALAGTWRRDFATRGRTLHRWDCLIAAAAVGVHATVATGNPKDFPMEGITVEHWPVGE
jgi:predicted nucleic acid-binding protein